MLLLESLSAAGFPSSEGEGLPTPAPRATRWDGGRSVSEGESGRAGGQGGRSRLAEGRTFLH